MKLKLQLQFRYDLLCIRYTEYVLLSIIQPVQAPAVFDLSLMETQSWQTSTRILTLVFHSTFSCSLQLSTCPVVPALVSCDYEAAGVFEGFAKHVESTLAHLNGFWSLVCFGL